MIAPSDLKRGLVVAMVKIIGAIAARAERLSGAEKS